MGGRIQWLMIVASLVFLLVVLELVRRRRLKEEYSLLWILAGVLILGLSIGRAFLERIAGFLGIYYAPSALFLLAGLVGLIMGLHFTAVISRLTDQNRALAQKMAILEERIARIDPPSRTHASTAIDPDPGVDPDRRDDPGADPECEAASSAGIRIEPRDPSGG